jgi:phosphoenolpyruvate synthase/pyruvate phosphate dikinase
MKTFYPFTAAETPGLTEVGGKGLSLILMTQAGLPVPRGFVLSVAFFDTWISALQATPQWETVQKSSATELKQTTLALKKLCLNLSLDRAQQQILKESLDSLQGITDTALFAVRSSSPEEDLEGASFAGGYETTLGVPSTGLEDALRQSFASSFDERVFLYKKERGFPTDQPRIAVIVQEQISAESSGVAFSLNPLNNCFDEAVINANFGLGESVVAGQVTPDSFVVDKIARAILETRIGSKETAIFLAPDGGTTESSPANRGQTCIAPEQVLALADMLVKVEAYYRKPVDIEWAFSGGKLHLLQARPITTYLPLPEQMVTAPGEPKRLYMDDTLLEQGLQEPLSVLGTEFYGLASAVILVNQFGQDVEGLDEGLSFTGMGRVYMQLSNYLRVLGKKGVVAALKAVDTTAASILQGIDTKQYLTKKTPKKLKWLIWNLIVVGAKSGISILKAYLSPEAYNRTYQETLPVQLEGLHAISQREQSVNALASSLLKWFADVFVPLGLPMIGTAQIARSRIKGIFGKDKESEVVQEQLARVEMALPGNKVVEMGAAMAHLASFEDVKAFDSGETFAVQLQAQTLSPDFLAAWNAYMAEFGFRCYRELDVATPRPYEQPAQFFAQLKGLSGAGNGNSKGLLEVTSQKREAAYKSLRQSAQRGGKARSFERNYKLLLMFGGFRETPKHYLILLTDIFRRRVLEVAQTLVDAQRLDRPDQIFDLTLDDIDRAVADPSMDVRAMAARNTAFLNRIKDRRDLPLVLDSRGKIYRQPPRDAKAGELVGEAISSGVVQGKVKILQYVDEKPLLPGEILVTRATDPGWTPLFINAGGIVLEVGGSLQHGAVIAREYGIPCISGLDEATLKLKDGQLVEVDGSNGIVRILSESSGENTSY